MTLSTRQRQEALTSMLWRELRRFEEQTGEHIERIVIGRVYEDISSMQINLDIAPKQVKSSQFPWTACGYRLTPDGFKWYEEKLYAV